MSSWMASYSEQVLRHENRKSKIFEKSITVESGKCSIRTTVLFLRVERRGCVPAGRKSKRYPGGSRKNVLACSGLRTVPKVPGG